MAGPDRAERGRAEPSGAGPSRAEPSRAEPEKTEPSRAKPSRAEGSPAQPKANSSQGEPAASVAQTPSWRESCPSRSQTVPPPVSRDLETLNSPFAGLSMSGSRRHQTVTVTAPRRRGTPASCPIKSLRGRGEKPRSRDGANPRVLTGQRITPSLRRSGSAP
ncbi:predicted GPI-anchored protein 58 [Grammomys surdaster]|uniref:predicted GPI-anchored protein 58 n=1 Tax=Grammomys surdaster TaxID=491861 RepID=UPI0010A0C2F9|nr:predicted GPI-anchored protein 58 [Grammomys surdaster]